MSSFRGYRCVVNGRCAEWKRRYALIVLYTKTGKNARAADLLQKKKWPPLPATRGKAAAVARKEYNYFIKNKEKQRK